MMDDYDKMKSHVALLCQTQMISGLLPSVREWSRFGDIDINSWTLRVAHKAGVLDEKLYALLVLDKYVVTTNFYHPDLGRPNILGTLDAEMQSACFTLSRAYDANKKEAQQNDKGPWYSFVLASGNDLAVKLALSDFEADTQMHYYQFNAKPDNKKRMERFAVSLIEGCDALERSAVLARLPRPLLESFVKDLETLAGHIKGSVFEQPFRNSIQSLTKASARLAAPVVPATPVIIVPKKEHIPFRPKDKKRFKL